MSKRNRLLLLTMLITITISTIAVLPAAAQLPTITRLDGSKLTSTEIDATVVRVMHAAEVTGVGLAIFDKGKVVYLKTYGIRDKEKNLPLTEDSVMTAASFSKVAFAYMVMELVDEKLLDLDKPVYTYLPKPLPEYPVYKDLADDSRYKKITARMLLSHTSGFPNWRWFNEDRKLNINFEPGSKFAYSGEGINLLQLVVETITNKPLQDLMRTHVFEPFAWLAPAWSGRAALRPTTPTAMTSGDDRSVPKEGPKPTPQVRCRRLSATLPASCRPCSRADN